VERDAELNVKLRLAFGLQILREGDVSGAAVISILLIIVVVESTK
jgi:hypothetical protein